MSLAALRHGLSVALTVAFLGAFAASYLKIKTTLIGYKLGELKESEQSLLEERSKLKMELAKLTKKENLTILVAKGDDSQTRKTKLAAH